MSKLTIVIATHGKFGEELLKSAEMIVGKTDNVYTASLLPDMSFDDFAAKVKALFEQIQGPAIALVDLYGGTPSNVLTVLTKKYGHQVITGLSLPMFIDLYMKSIAEKVPDVMEMAEGCVLTAKEGTVITNKCLAEEEQERRDTNV